MPIGSPIGIFYGCESVTWAMSEHKRTASIAAVIRLPLGLLSFNLYSRCGVFSAGDGCFNVLGAGKRNTHSA